MKLRFLLLAVAGVLVTMLGIAVPTASAQSGCPATTANPYPPSAPSLSLTQGQVFAGDSITITGTCFTPNTVVNLEFQPGPVVLGSVQTNAGGTFSRSVTIPADATVGVHSIVATDGRFTQTATVTVLARAGAGGLVRTGASFAIPFTVAGVALIGVGAMAVLAARRKRAGTVAAVA